MKVEAAVAVVQLAAQSVAVPQQVEDRRLERLLEDDEAAG